MKLDWRERKLFVGTSGGEIFTVNVMNGAKMMEFDSHYCFKYSKKERKVVEN